MALSLASIPAAPYRLERFESRRPELLARWFAAADEFAREALGCAGGAGAEERVEDSRPEGGFDVVRTLRKSYVAAGGLSVEATLTETLHPHDGEHWGVSLRLVGAARAGAVPLVVIASWGPSLPDTVSVMYSDCPVDPAPALARALAAALAGA